MNSGDIRAQWEVCYACVKSNCDMNRDRTFFSKADSNKNHKASLISLPAVQEISVSVENACAICTGVNFEGRDADVYTHTHTEYAVTHVGFDLYVRNTLA